MATAVSRPTKLWWLIGLVLLCLCLVVQLPASWIIQKFAPNNPYLQQITGNLWQGQANWQLATDPTKMLTGTVGWRWQPLQLVTGKLGFRSDIRSGKTNLIGNVRLNKTNWHVNGFNGKISADTLKQLMNWQLPDTPITVKDLAISHSSQGFEHATGVLNWTGGELGYPSGGRVYKITMPTMMGTLSLDKAGSSATPLTPNNSPNNPNASQNSSSPNNGQRLHLALTTPQGQRLGDIYVDSDNMVDVALTQRLLKNMPDYKGQAADDSIVVSLRQPLSSMK